MSITTSRTKADATRRTDDETTANAADDGSDPPLAISCPICGSILPLDTIEPSDREEIECRTCRNVRGIEEVFV